MPFVFGSENVSIRKFITYIREGSEYLTAEDVIILNVEHPTYEIDIWVTTWETTHTIFDVFNELISGNLIGAFLPTALTLFKSLFVKIGDTIGDSFDAKVETGASIELTESGEKAISKNATLSVDVAEFTANNVNFFEELDGKKLCVLTTSTRTDVYGIPDSINLYKPCTYNYSESLGSSNATTLPFMISYNNVSNKNEIKLSGVMNANTFEEIYAYTDESGLKLYLVLSKNISDSSLINVNDFEVLSDLVGIDIASYSISDNIVRFLLKDAIRNSETATIAYAKDTDLILSSDDDELASFTAMSVENNAT